MTYLYQIRWPEGFVVPEVRRSTRSYLITDRAAGVSQRSPDEHHHHARSKQSVQTWFYAAPSLPSPWYQRGAVSQQLGIISTSQLRCFTSGARSSIPTANR